MKANCKGSNNSHQKACQQQAVQAQLQKLVGQKQQA
jgi:hypothetical protein